MLVRSGRGELCCSPTFAIRLFVKGAWSCSKFVMLVKLTAQGGWQLWKLPQMKGWPTWADRRCELGVWCEVLLWQSEMPLLTIHLNHSLSLSWHKFSVLHGLAGLGRIQLRASGLLMLGREACKGNRQTAAGGWSRIGYKWPSKTTSVIAVAFKNHSDVGRSGWAIGLSCSLTQNIFLFPPRQGWWQLVAGWEMWPAEPLHCFGGSAQAVVLQHCLGKPVALAMCRARSQGVQPRLLSFPQDFVLKVRLYDPQMSAFSELVLRRQNLSPQI